MISLLAIPERIIEGETLKIRLDIQGKINLKLYKGTYFNIILKENGNNLSPIKLYPLRFNGFPLEWEVNENSYNFNGTYNVKCIIQDSNQIANTTFIIEPKCIINKINICSNITNLNQINNSKDFQIKKKEIPIDYTGGCSIQKPNTIIKEEPIKNNIVENELNSILISNVNVQIAYKNVNSNF